MAASRKSGAEAGEDRTAGVPGRARRKLAARGALERLQSGSTDLRAAALLDADGSQLASTDGRDWSEESTAIWVSAGADGGDGGASTRPVAVHVATQEGELFALRDGSASILATAERFALASLMQCDLRAALRDLETSGAG